ncbi:hypothetical protein FIBSPDRAFT_741712, partial [Athelia psychrophila]
MALPAGLPTLEHSSSKSWTRPDNVWVDDALLNGVISCKVDPGQRPTKTDHLPMTLQLDLTPARIETEEKFDWRATPWKDFSEAMATEVRKLRTAPIRNIRELESAIKELDEIMIRVRDSHVPKVKPSIYTKRWWSRELSEIRGEVRRLAKKVYLKVRAGLMADPVHEEHRKKRAEYV